jgi:hypothetical protein
MLRCVAGYSNRAGIAACAVKNLGFVHLKPGPDGLTVSMRPGLVSRLAMIGAIDVIARSRPPRVLVCSVPRLRAPETFADLDEALARIEELAELGVGRTIRPLYDATRCRLDDIDTAAGGRMQPLLRLWNAADRGWRPTVDEEFRRTQMLERSLVCSEEPRVAGLVIRHWGRTVDLVRGQWQRVAAGRAIESCPIPVIGSLLAHTYRQTIADAEPRLDVVDLVIETLDRQIVRRRRYDRLVLPWKGKGGRSVVTAVGFPRWTETYN